MPIDVNFDFPEGCSENYKSVSLPEMPRIGDSIQQNLPKSGRYRVAAVIFEIDAEHQRCDSIRVELAALDKINS